MEDLVGPSSSLCENIGHTYNSMGDFQKADEYFEKSLKLMGPESTLGKRTHRNGVLLGLGLVKDRLGLTREALPILLQALEGYKEEAQGNDSSLAAKAHMSVSKAYLKIAEMDKSEEHIRESVRIFKKTCGNSSPLTAHANDSLANVLYERKDFEGSRKAYKRALKIHAIEDSINLQSIVETLTRVNEIQNSKRDKKTSEELQNSFKPYIPILNQIEKNIKQHEIE